MTRRTRDGEPLPYERAWNYALWLLGRQAYTEAQVRERLARKGSPPADVERILERLRELRFTDDRAFAETYVENRMGRKGPLALRHEMARKGVPEDAIRSSLTRLDDDTQLASAVAVLERQLPRYARDEPQRVRAKAYAFLARRGFPSPVAREALERVLGEE